MNDLDVEMGSSPPLRPGRSFEKAKPTYGHRVKFRGLLPTDRDVIQEYHEQWFPVKYDDEFYDELVQNRMVGTGHPLYTCCVVVEENGVEELAACVVGAFGRTRRLSTDLQNLLVTDPIRHGKVFYIMTLGTVGRYRGCKMGSTLINKCIRLVEREPSCGVVYLHVITFNVAAIQFYENLGFSRVQEIKDYYVINGEHFNCYLYARYFHGKFAVSVDQLCWVTVLLTR